MNKSDIHQPRRSSQIDGNYVDLRTSQERQEWQKIEKPKEAKPIDEKTYRNATVIFALALVVGVVYWQFFREPKVANPPTKEKQASWHMVRLVDKEVFYGQVVNQSADPVVLTNVYYDYDQPKDGEEQKTEETPNMRLVKRGKEAHGPSGTMNIIRSQILFMEPLNQDSKVLKAIEEYEKGQ